MCATVCYHSYAVQCYAAHVGRPRPRPSAADWGHATRLATLLAVTHNHAALVLLLPRSMPVSAVPLNMHSGVRHTVALLQWTQPLEPKAKVHGWQWGCQPAVLIAILITLHHSQVLH